MTRLLAAVLALAVMSLLASTLLRLAVDLAPTLLLLLAAICVARVVWFWTSRR